MSLLPNLLSLGTLKAELSVFTLRFCVRHRTIFQTLFLRFFAQFLFGGHIGSAQALLLTLHLGITPGGGLRGPYEVPGVEPEFLPPPMLARQASYMLTVVLSLWSHHYLYLGESPTQ